MDVVLYSARGMFSLLLANFLLGIITAILRSLIDDFELFVISLWHKRFMSFREYMCVNEKKRISEIFIDVTIYLLAASLMLVIAFICNSGNFRLVSIPVFILGFAFEQIVLDKVVDIIVNRILFCFKWTVDILVFPIIWLATIVVRLLYNTIDKIRSNYRAKILTRYTECSFAHIKDEAKYGLLDKYYEEIENERTV
jgi:hypothetical protein